MTRQTSWLQKRTSRPVIIAIAVVFIGAVLVFLAYRFQITGTGFLSKAVWDWLQLFIVPLALAGVAYFFNRSTSSAEQANTQKRYENDQKIVAEKQKDELLQIYLDRMSELLLNNHLRTSKPDDEVRYIAQSRTLTILPQLDARHKCSIILFLYNAGLISTDKGSIIDLSNADLKSVNLSGATLNGINLSRTDLSGANLNVTFLAHADLRGANLNGANLSEAFLNEADLREITIREATMSHGRTFSYSGRTRLIGANLYGARLYRANLQGTDLTKADLRMSVLGEAKLIRAYLNEADLSGAILLTVDLHGSDLTGANFSGADIHGANLLKTIQKDTNFSGVDLSTAYTPQ